MYQGGGAVLRKEEKKTMRLCQKKEKILCYCLYVKIKCYWVNPLKCKMCFIQSLLILFNVF